MSLAAKKDLFRCLIQSSHTYYSPVAASARKSRHLGCARFLWLVCQKVTRRGTCCSEDQGHKY